MIHAYVRADLKYNLLNSKSKKYSRFLKNKTQMGGVITGNNNKHKFDIQIDNDEDDTLIKIFIGNKKNDYCILGLIDKEVNTEIIIDTFNYYNTCNITNDLVKSSGMFKMMNTFITYIKAEFPNVKKAILTDEAYFICNDKFTSKSERINLYTFYTIKYGIPYYVKNHSFNFENKKDAQKHENNLTLLNDVTFKYADFLSYLKGIDYDHDIPDTLNTILDMKKEYNFSEIKEIVINLADNGYCHILNELLEYIFVSNKMIILRGITYSREL